MADINYCIQCTDKISGKIGNFIYNNNEPFKAISPVFDNLIDLFNWMKENNYKTKPYSDDGNTYHPFKVVTT